MPPVEPQAPQTPPQPPAPAPQTPVTPPLGAGLLTSFCLAIQSREGYYPPGALKGYPNGTPAYFNHNPGNLRCVEGNKANWEHRAVDGGAKHNNFCVFPDYATGFEALQEVVVAVCKGQSAAYNDAAKKLGLYDCSYLSIKQYFVVRDPSSDGNDPASFADEVAAKLNVPTGTMMRQLL